MRKIETAFLGFVIAFALLIAGLSLARYAEIRATPGEASVAGSLGKPRDLALERIRRIIQQGDLSDHEALFYNRSPSAVPGRPGFETPQPTPAAEEAEPPTRTRPIPSGRGMESALGTGD
jgi:hypothetical protein